MTTSLPKITEQLLAAAGLIGPNPWRVLICGQIGALGTAVSGTPVQEVQNLSNTEIEGYFGSNSDMTNRINRFLSIAGGYVSLWAVGLASGVSSVAASFVQALTGTATAAGTITVIFADALDYTVQVAVSIGDTAAVVANNIEAAFNTLSGVPMTISNNSAGTLTYTAADTGTLGNKYGISVSNVPAGLTIPSGQFSGGSVDPTLTNIFSNCGTRRFHTVLWPWQTSYTALTNFLTPRNTINNAFLQGEGFIGYDDTETNIHTALNGVTPVNNQNLVFFGNKQNTGVSAILTPPDWRTAEVAAIEALRMTAGVPIGQYVTVSSAPLDNIGGPGLASLNYAMTPLAKTAVTDPNLLFTATEQASAQTDGFTVIGVNESASSMVLAETVTTYKFNTKGQPDVSFAYLNYIRTGYMCLEIFYNTLKSDYAQFRLTPGDLVAGRAMTNIAQITGEFQRINKLLSGPDYCLTAGGKVAEQYFSDNLTITANYATGVITASGQLSIVTQIRTINITFQLNFSIGG